MSSSGFIFDIIVLRIDVPSQTFEDPNLLSVDVNFNNVTLKITSSRINVVEFRSGRSYEFEANPYELRNNLEREPLKIYVNYNDNLIGTGDMVWPNCVLQKINDAMVELTHIDEVELQDGENRVGCVGVIVRLQMKCQELNQECLNQCDDIRKHLNKVINPQDILFVVGDNPKENECHNLFPRGSGLSNEMQHTTALDLSRYRAVNGQLVESPDVLNTCNNPECCELKKISKEYQKIFETLNKGTCKKSPRACTASAHCAECPHTNKFSSSCTNDSSEIKIPSCFNSSSNDDCIVKLITGCPQTSCPNLPQTFHKTPKNCPVCKENISWLPKLACCPKCGYKPVPCIEEKNYNEKLTAEQILQEYLDKKQSNTDTPNAKPKKECRCTCKNGKICAHCRIKKLCSDIFQNETKKDVKSEADDCGKCESTEMYNICKSSSKDCRPYLARVFSELKDLYDIKEAKRKSFDYDPACERELAGRARKKHKIGKKLRQMKMKVKMQAQQQKQQKMEKHQNKKDNKTKAVSDNGSQEGMCKKKPKRSRCPCRNLYAHKLVNSPCKIGHKTCVNGFAAGRKNVPRNMGWLWNLDPNRVMNGWKPGAIRKPIKELMKFFLKDFPADTLRVSQYCYRKGAKREEEPEEELVQKPTLHICKKNDEYYITLRPLKDPEALKVCADPYLNMKPIQFKITKNPMMVERRKLKRCLKDMGFSKCTCHEPIVNCFCRSFIDKKKLEYITKKECQKRGLECCTESLVLSDTTDSDVEFDFGVTPPAGVIKPERLKKPNLVSHGTQYLASDWNTPPIFPKPINRYMRVYDCATGDRYNVGKHGANIVRTGGDTRGQGGQRGGRGGRGGGAGGGRGRGKDGKCPITYVRGPPGAGGPAGPGGPKNKLEGATPGSVNMLQYLKGKDGRIGSKAGPGELSEKAKRRRALGEIPPPLLCMVDRRGKPYDCGMCAADFCMPHNRIC